MSIHTESYVRDGITYIINVEKEDGYYWGCWECLDDGEKGSSSKRCTTTHEAVMAAQANTTLHHDMNHKKSI